MQSRNTMDSSTNSSDNIIIDIKNTDKSESGSNLKEKDTAIIDIDQTKKNVPNVDKSAVNDPIVDLIQRRPKCMLSIFSAGLFFSYLIWGSMQERIMAHPYGDSDNDDNW